jgi:YD repeat-containing protein
MQRSRRNKLICTCAWAFVAMLPCLFPIEGAFAANGSVAYTYDALGRVITVSYDTGVCLIYSYDPNGNRTSQVVNVNVNGSGSPSVWGCFNWGQAPWTQS